MASTLGSFFNKLNWFEEILSLVASLVAFIGAMIIWSTLRTVLNERIREFAILRCLGASRRELTLVVLSQSILMSLIGALGSLLCYFLIHMVSANLIREQTGVLMGALFLIKQFCNFWGPLLIGLLSGFLPSIQVYRVSLSETLSRKPDLNP